MTHAPQRADLSVENISISFPQEGHFLMDRVGVRWESAPGIVASYNILPFEKYKI